MYLRSLFLKKKVKVAGRGRNVDQKEGGSKEIDVEDVIGLGPGDFAVQIYCIFGIKKNSNVQRGLAILDGNAITLGGKDPSDGETGRNRPKQLFFAMSGCAGKSGELAWSCRNLITFCSRTGVTSRACI